MQVFQTTDAEEYLENIYKPYVAATAADKISLALGLGDKLKAPRKANAIVTGADMLEFDNDDYAFLKKPQRQVSHLLSDSQRNIIATDQTVLSTQLPIFNQSRETVDKTIKEL